MKKFRLLALVAVLLVSVMVLSSCGTVWNLNKVYNKNYDVSEEYYTNVEKLGDLTDFVKAKSNSEFAIFGKEDTIKVFGFRKGEVLKTITTGEEADYDISFVSGAPIFCVTKTTPATEEGEDDVVTNTYYDAQGDEILSVKANKEIGTPNVVSDKVVVINSVAYAIDVKTGAVEEKAEIPPYITADFDACTDKYYYDFEDTTIIIYDDEFVPTATWTAPSYAEMGLEPKVLNNGNVLVQYSVTLDEDAKDFDIYDEDGKYDLVTKIITPKGNVKNVNLDYIVMYVMSNYDLYDEAEEKEDNEFTNKFQNIAVIAKIENQQVDTSVEGLDYVLMNNSGKAQQSLKLVEGQAGAPVKIGDDLYAVETVYGEAVIKGNGKIKFTFTNDEVMKIGSYFVTEYAIYDLDFEKVYDLTEEDVAFDESVGDTVFVKEGDDDKYSIIAFCNGEKETVYSYDKESATNKEFEYTDFGYLITDKEAEKPYTYYTANGEKLMNTVEKFIPVAEGYDGAMIVSVVEDGAVNYYLLTK